MAEQQERQNCTSPNRQIPPLFWNRCYWSYIDFYTLTFLYYLHLYLYSVHWLLHQILILQFTRVNVFLYYAIKTTELMTCEVVSFEKVFGWTKCLASKSQKFILLKCIMKAWIKADQIHFYFQSFCNICTLFCYVFETQFFLTKLYQCLKNFKLCEKYNFLLGSLVHFLFSTRFLIYCFFKLTALILIKLSFSFSYFLVLLLNTIPGVFVNFTCSNLCYATSIVPKRLFNFWPVNSNYKANILTNF